MGYPDRMPSGAFATVVIRDLVADKRLDGITAMRNETSREGRRLVLELRRDAIPRVVLNQLYKHTPMQATFGVIMLALVPDATTRQLVPKVMALKERKAELFSSVIDSGNAFGAALSADDIRGLFA